MTNPVINIKDLNKIGGIVSFSKFIILTRKQMKISQAELAFKAKISQPYLSRIEKGSAKDVPMTRVVALVEALGYSIMAGQITFNNQE